ncbi:MAG: pseudouridine synthase [Bacteroidales bacterium]|jgi:23S rRNA pseudouridine2605 synthase|nr:pseudouridine synthase [Bacteroidales bacterium]
MEDNKRGTRKRIVRKASEGHAEKVDYSTSRSFGSSEDRPRRPYGAGHSQGNNSHRGPRPEGGYSSHRPDGEHRSSFGNKPRTERPYGEKTSYGDRPRRSGYGKPSFGSKPGYGNKPGGRKPFAKRNQADEGMKAMLSRKPQVNGRYSDDDTAPTEIQEVVRLNKFIANSGVCSRREADTLIQSGVVTVNGEVVTELGTKVNILTDDIRFNGQRLKGEEKVYIVMNKPKGYVTTASDPHAEKTVMDLLKGCPTRVFPVGRLDKNTTGVLMFTNDGEMAERLTHPSYNKKKIYQVVLDAPLSDEDQQKILAGIELSDGIVSADELEFIDAHDHRQLGIEIHSGKNRIVRRIFESLGYEVRALDRVYFAGLTKKGLKKSDWRYLTEGEVNILKMGAYV